MDIAQLSPIIAQVCAALALSAVAIRLCNGVVRVLCAGAAVLLIATAPGLVSFGGDTADGLLVLPAWSAHALAGGAFALALLAFVAVLRPGAASNARMRATAAYSGARDHARIAEARQSRLKGLLKREHEKLQNVSEMHRYFELATRNSQITVSYQDAELVYGWIVNPRDELFPSDIIGHSEERLPEEVRALVIGHKRRALMTGATQSFELELAPNGERAWFRVDVVPIAEYGGTPTGIVCTAIDITRSKRLDLMRTDLSRRLAETLQRFNLALRSERIMVFSQDLDLRYTWANSDDTQVGAVVGRTEEEVTPEADRDAIISIKRQVIESKRPASAEVGVGEGSERRWYDLHVEPNLGPDGSVTGITCASIDVTHRRRNEEQMRLVMRELTHRTKNLLAVVIAIARQTANQADTVALFVPALIARLRALSAAQDLIVADDWAGVDIADLVRVLIGQYVPPQSSRVHIEGPVLLVSPEASQNLGLAVHELAANAVQFGAFANAAGTVSVTWECIDTPKGQALRLVWREAGGPIVAEPTRRGFGMTVIERNLSRALDADVSLSFEEKGLCAEITIPLDGVVPFQSTDRMRLAQAS